LKICFQPEAFLVKIYVEKVCTGKVTFGETTIIDGIQQVGFSLSIHPTNTNYITVEIKLA
jgi:hypothetical protein